MAPRDMERSPSHHPIIKDPQHPHNAECYDPRLRPENQDRMDHCHVEPPRGPGVIPLPYQQAGQPSPFTPCYMEVPDHSIPVTVIKGQNIAKVFEGIHLIENMVTEPEIRPCSYPGGIGG